MNEGDDIEKQKVVINRRLSELEEKDRIGWYDKGDRIRESTLTDEERKEMKQLQEQLEELDDA